MVKVRDAIRFVRPLYPRPQPVGQVRTIHGEPIHFIEAGDGPPLLLIHGLMGNTSMWRNVLPQLSEQYRVIAVDLVGFGHSTRRNERPLSLEGHAARLDALLTELGVARASIVGHSLGGAIAQRLAISYASRVDRLVLIASLHAEDAPVWGGAAKRAYAAARYAGVVARFPFLVRMLTASALRRLAISPGEVTSAQVRAYSTPLFRSGTLDAFLRMFAAVDEEAAADLSQLAVQALVVSGAQDSSVPVTTGERLAERIHGSRHVVLDGAGHLCVEEEGDAIAALILNFLAQEPLRQ